VQRAKVAKKRSKSMKVSDENINPWNVYDMYLYTPQNDIHQITSPLRYEGCRGV
jgi:hypothetical protein